MKTSLPLVLLFTFFWSWPKILAQCITEFHDDDPITGWLSCNPSTNPNAALGSGHWLLVDLGKVRTLDELIIWNYNESGNESNGFNDFRIDLALTLDSWNFFASANATLASGTNNQAGELMATFNGEMARYLLLTAVSNHGGSCYGLAELSISFDDNIACNEFYVEAHIASPVCPGSATGTIEINAYDGLAPYQYNWSTGSNSSSITGLMEGLYTVSVTDQLGCTQAMSFVLDDPSIPLDVYNQIPIPSDHYYDNDTITSVGIVAYNGTVNYSSTNPIELNEEFEVVIGGEFSATVEDCVSQTQTSTSTLYSDSSNYHPDYIGSGHMDGINVSASDEAQETKALYVIGGYGMQVDSFASSRFLSQSTLGADYSMIHDLDSMGLSDWLDWQSSIPRQDFMASFQTVLDSVYVDPGNGLIGFQYFRMAWWHNMLTGEDFLRDRIAFHLTQLFVVSDKSDLMNLGEGLASYYDLIHQHALGNFRDLLFHVTMHPSMGLYLSHLNNPKADTTLNQFPDENYAREVMQLFSIGLLELESNGDLKKNIYGNEIPTYSNDEVIEFSKVFTGLGFDHPMAEFGSRRFYDMTLPMIMYEDFHEPGPKYLLYGDSIPSGQTGMQDINDAIDNIFHHPNVAPFVCRRLIQYLVTSNPSSEYLQRVVDAFENDGSGVRGDMMAVIKAILMDPEARNCYYQDQPGYGKLVEPIIRYLQFLKALNVFSSDNTFYSVGGLFQELTFQAPLGAPSVFNFFSPDYVPSGLPEGTFLRGPEFQILNSYTAIGNYNLVNLVKDNEQVLQHVRATVQLDLSYELSLAFSPENLIDHLDLLFTHGQMSSGTRSTILEALNLLSTSEDRVKMALYLILTSPEYVVNN